MLQVWAKQHSGIWEGHAQPIKNALEVTGQAKYMGNPILLCKM